MNCWFAWFCIGTSFGVVVSAGIQQFLWWQADRKRKRAMAAVMAQMEAQIEATPLYKETEAAIATEVDKQLWGEGPDKEWKGIPVYMGEWAPPGKVFVSNKYYIETFPFNSDHFPDDPKDAA